MASQLVNSNFSIPHSSKKDSINFRIMSSYLFTKKLINQKMKNYQECHTLGQNCMSMVHAHTQHLWGLGFHINTDLGSIWYRL